MGTAYKVPTISFIHSVESHKAVTPDGPASQVNLVSVPCAHLYASDPAAWAGLMQPLLQSPDLGLPHPSHRDLVTATLTHMWLSVTSCGLWSPEPAARLLSSSHC